MCVRVFKPVSKLSLIFDVPYIHAPGAPYKAALILNGQLNVTRLFSKSSFTFKKYPQGSKNRGDVNLIVI